MFRLCVKKFYRLLLFTVCLAIYFINALTFFKIIRTNASTKTLFLTSRKLSRPTNGGWTLTPSKQSSWTWATGLGQSLEPGWPDIRTKMILRLRKDQCSAGPAESPDLPESAPSQANYTSLIHARVVLTRCSFFIFVPNDESSQCQSCKSLFIQKVMIRRNSYSFLRCPQLTPYKI